MVVELSAQQCDMQANAWSVSLSPADASGSSSGSISQPIYLFGLNPGTNYAVSVVATNTAGNSDPSTHGTTAVIIATYSVNGPNNYIDCMNGNIVDASFDGTEWDAQSGSAQLQGTLSPPPLVVFVGSLPLQGSNNVNAFVLTQDPANGGTPTSFGTSVNPSDGSQMDQFGNQVDNVQDPIYYITTDGALLNTATNSALDPITNQPITGLSNQPLNTPPAYSLSGYSALYFVAMADASESGLSKSQLISSSKSLTNPMSQWVISSVSSILIALLLTGSILGGGLIYVHYQKNKQIQDNYENKYEQIP